ncbi:MAG: hypothetical protein ABIQ12_02155 [Opitutaceae bacterium]
MPLTFSKLIRRTHMYLALFLTPWMIAYALSGLVLNHGETVRGWYGGNYGNFEKIEERPYAIAFSAEETPHMIAEQILDDLGLAGSFGIPPGGSTPARLIINRNAAFTLHRITFFRAEQRLLVEQQRLAAPVVVNRVHFRHGYEQPYVSAKLWGGIVDLVVVGMGFWVASGVILWWEIRPARTWGAASLIAGLAIFTGLLATI